MMDKMLYNVQISFWSFRYHLMFSLTGGGKYNFLGTKRWIEENLDHAGEFFSKRLGFVLYRYGTDKSEHEQPSMVYF